MHTCMHAAASAQNLVRAVRRKPSRQTPLFDDRRHGGMRQRGVKQRGVRQLFAETHSACAASAWQRQQTTLTASRYLCACIADVSNFGENRVFNNVAGASSSRRTAVVIGGMPSEGVESIAMSEQQLGRRKSKSTKGPILYFVDISHSNYGNIACRFPARETGPAKMSNLSRDLPRQHAHHIRTRQSCPIRLRTLWTQALFAVATNAQVKSRST